MVDEHILLIDVKARVDAVWEQMNKGASNSVLQSLCRKRASNPKENKQKSSSVSTSFFFFSLSCSVFQRSYGSSLLSDSVTFFS